MKQSLLLLLLMLRICFIKAQNHEIDSLLSIVKKNIQDTNQVNVLNKLSKKIGWAVGNYDTALVLAKQAQILATKLNYKKGVAVASNNIGLVYADQADYPKALEYYFKSLKLNEEIANKQGQAASLGNIGIVYDNQADYPKALDYYLKSLKINEEIGNKQGQANNLGNIGVVYMYQSDYPKALDYYFKALRISEEIGNKVGQAINLGNLGNVYKDQSDYPKALGYYFKALKIFEEIDDKQGEVYTLGNIGIVYMQQTDFPKALDYYLSALKMSEVIGDKHGQALNLGNIGIVYSEQANFINASVTLRIKALEYYLKALSINEEIGNKQEQAINLGNIGIVYTKLKQYVKAEIYLKQAEKINKELGTLNVLKDNCHYLSTLYEQTGRQKEALVYYKEYITLKDSIFSEENAKKTMQKEMQFNYEKKAAADSVKVAEEKKVTAAQLKQEKTQRFALYGGLALVAFFAAFMFNRFRVTQKQKNIIELKEQETQKQNLVITEQKHLIEERHKEITDSINYAERIQRSFLATEQHLNENLKEYFVFFKPKDVVSGDFYWSATLNNGNFALVTADSTGHGVPGAIMSLLNITSLEKAIEKHNNPGGILNLTRKIIIERLKRDGSEEGGKDGMDCSLCTFDFSNNKLLMAAAHNPVWIVRDSETIEIKPDKMPVGKHDKQNELFTQHEIELQKGDVIYTLTDGFPDQFGGDKGKKFMSKNLRELLVTNTHLSMLEQKQLLETTFSNWKGDLEQVDDVTVIGIRV